MTMVMVSSIDGIHLRTAAPASVLRVLWELATTHLPVSIPVGSTGDSMDRVVVRILEVMVSTTIVVLLVAMVSTTTLRGDANHCMSTHTHGGPLRSPTRVWYS